MLMPANKTPLEGQIRQLRWTVWMFGTAVLLLAVWQALPDHGTRASDTLKVRHLDAETIVAAENIRAPKFFLVDDKDENKLLGQWDSRGGGSALVLRDKKERARVVLQTDQDNGGHLRWEDETESWSHLGNWAAARGPLLIRRTAP
jgi:hypothetical protein